jgi:hypothetical protein
MPQLQPALVEINKTAAKRRGRIGLQEGAMPLLHICGATIITSGIERWTKAAHELGTRPE